MMRDKWKNNPYKNEILKQFKKIELNYCESFSLNQIILSQWQYFAVFLVLVVKILYNKYTNIIMESWD